LSESLARFSAGGPAAGSERLLVGSIHCHSTLSDGSATPRQILSIAADAGLDFVAITDHVPPAASDVPGKERKSGPSSLEGGALPLIEGGVLRIPGLEFSPPRNHYLVLGLDPWEVPDPTGLPGWPDRASSCVEAVSGRPGVLGFMAHPDDEGNPLLKVDSYRWDDWTVQGSTGMEIWNLSTDWSRVLRSYRDVLRALAVGLYRAVPPPHPATLARWDRLAQERAVVGIAGTDAHAYPVKWHGLSVTVLPYGPALQTLQTAVWVGKDALEASPEERVRLVLDAVGRGRTFMVNRAWGYPTGFSFRARLPADGDTVFQSGDTVPAGVVVRFEATVPWPAWLRLVRNGRVVANTYGRELTFEPYEGEGSPGAPTARGAARQEAWRAEVWVHSGHWTRSGSGFFLWILSNFIYRSLR